MTAPISLQGTGMLFGDIARRDEEIRRYMDGTSGGGLPSISGGISRIGGASNSRYSSSGQPLNTGLSTQNNNALESLIAQLAGGGTANMQADRAARAAEADTLRSQRSGYSKDAAFADSKALMDATLRQTLEKLMPTINASSLGAGTSQSSMRALLTQKASQQAADSAAAQGMSAAVNYGNIANGTSAILERLLATNDPASAALIQALNVAKTPAQQQSSGNAGAGVTMPGILPSTQYSSASSNPTMNNFGGGGVPFSMVQYGGETPEAALDRQALGNVGTTPGSRLFQNTF